MEADGVLECCLSSVIKRQLRYVTYIGDGDTKSYQNVVNATLIPVMKSQKQSELAMYKKLLERGYGN